MVGSSYIGINTYKPLIHSIRRPARFLTSCLTFLFVYFCCLCFILAAWGSVIKGGFAFRSMLLGTGCVFDNGVFGGSVQCALFETAYIGGFRNYCVVIQVFNDRSVF